MSTMMIEIINYKFKSNVSQKEADQAHQVLNDFMLDQPGFLYRSVSETEGEIFDVNYWKDEASLHAAGEKFPDTQACALISSLTVESSLIMRQMPVLVQATSDNSQAA